MTTFGRYTLVRRVGVGGMAEIWKAKAQGPAGFQKTLAIKKVLPELSDDQEFVSMFIEEAKLVASLYHPNIVQVFDFGQAGEREYFIAMEYVPGTNLSALFQRMRDKREQMPTVVILYVALEAAKALGYAHSRTEIDGKAVTLVHRDVSPHNILVSFNGEVKLTDFGIAKRTELASKTAVGHIKGKLVYMSPEQAAGRPLDARSDLFSLGLVLYELTTGKRLFQGSTAAEIAARISGFHALSPEELAGSPAELESVLRRLLQSKGTDRYQTALELEMALGGVLGPEGVVQGRQALAWLVQWLFESERSLDVNEPSKESSIESRTLDYSKSDLPPAPNLGSPAAPPTSTAHSPGPPPEEESTSTVRPAWLDDVSRWTMAPGAATGEVPRAATAGGATEEATQTTTAESPPRTLTLSRPAPSSPAVAIEEHVPPNWSSLPPEAIQSYSRVLAMKSPRPRWIGPAATAAVVLIAVVTTWFVARSGRAPDTQPGATAAAGAKTVAASPPPAHSAVAAPPAAKPADVVVAPAASAANSPPPDAAAIESALAKETLQAQEKMLAKAAQLAKERSQAKAAPTPASKAKPTTTAAPKGSPTPAAKSAAVTAEATPAAVASPVASVVEVDFTKKPVAPVVEVDFTKKAKAGSDATAAAPAPKAASASPKAGGPTRISVKAKPWVEVWIDGKLVAPETPLRNHELTPGKHKLRFVHPSSKAVLEKQIEVAAGADLQVQVDVKAKSVTVE